MASKGRSLEIVAVGLGQAGGNLAAEFHRRGYRALALNTARTDLTSLGAGRLTLPEKQRLYIGLDDGDGAGIDLAFGRECIHEHAARIREAVEEHAVGADVVVLAAGLGGGTGSCVAELVRALEDLGLPIVVLSTLPHAHENGIVKANALHAVKDLATTRTYGWILVDDAKLAKAHQDAPLDRYYETINRAIVEPLDRMNRLNQGDGLHALRALDGEDFRTLLLAGGILSYAEGPLQTLEFESVMEQVRRDIRDNPLMPSGGQLEKVAYLGLVIEAPEAVLAQSPFSLYERIAETLKRETEGGAVYVGLYRSAEGESPRLRMLSTSQALPGGVEAMVEEVEREAGAIQRKCHEDVAGLDLAGIEKLELFRRPVLRGARMARQAIGADARPPAPRAATGAPAKQARKPKAPAPQDAPARAPIKVRTPAPEAAPTALAAQAAPAAPASQGGSFEDQRVAFERLVSAFRSAQIEEKRGHIARQLEAGAQAPEPLVRFYAVHAMARLDKAIFGKALRAALDDADPHVASLAGKALSQSADRKPEAKASR